METAEERDIRRYVELESVGEDDPVKSVELVKRHRVMGEAHEVFDVRCRRSRWWVVTNATNLYSQDEFRTADYAFSFHLGIMLRMWERDRVTIEDEPRSISEGAWRRYEDAVEALGEANDTADYQSIGILLRETMISLVKDQAANERFNSLPSLPKESDVKSWIAILAAEMSSKRRQSSYLRSLWEKTWDLVVHLQHDSNSVAWDAEVAVNAVNHALETFMYMRARVDRDSPRRCPRCDSERYSSALDVTEGQRVETWFECSACGFASDRQVSEF